MPESAANRLFLPRLKALLEALPAAPDAEAVWLRVDQLLAAVEAEEDAEIALPIWDRDLVGVEARIAAWEDLSAPLVEHDKALLKRAFKAYKKRLKLMRLDDESTAGVNPLSAGRQSTILGIRAPVQYPEEVWAFLVKQGKLLDAGDGLLELGTV